MTYVKSIYGNKILSLLLGVQVVVYFLIILSDVLLVNWYEYMYNSVMKRDTAQFYSALAKLMGIVLMQATLLALAAYVSDLHEAGLKKFFSSEWREFGASSDIDGIKSARADQRLIDDASLAAERLAHTIPSIFYNLCKAMTFIVILQSFSITSAFGVGWPLAINPIVVFGVTYVVLQWLTLKRAKLWVDRTEYMKRNLEARLRYSILSSGRRNMGMTAKIDQYIYGVNRIRFYVTRAHSLNVFSIHWFSLCSMIIPVSLSYGLLVDGSITFGEFMKIGASYASFQNSFTAIFTSYREVFQGASALRRLMTRPT